MKDNQSEFSIGSAGALQFPLLLALIIIALSGFRIWGFLRNWRFLVETQLRLDRCVGEVAQEFRVSLNAIELSNQGIKKLRAAIQRLELQPHLIPPLRLGLMTQVSKQELIRERWKLKRQKWTLSKGCGKQIDEAQPLPALNYLRHPEDSIGPQVLHWDGIMPEEFEFQVSHRPRYAAAKVKGGLGEKIPINLGSSENPESSERSSAISERSLDTNEPPNETRRNQWKAEWSIPHQSNWANFR